MERTPIVWDLRPNTRLDTKRQVTLRCSGRSCQVLVSKDDREEPPVMLKRATWKRTMWGRTYSSVPRCRRRADPISPLFSRAFRSDLLDHNCRRATTLVHLAAGRNSLSGEGHQFI